MTTDLSSGKYLRNFSYLFKSYSQYFIASIPQFYKQLFNICSEDGQPVLHEVYEILLKQCKLSSGQIERIYKLVGTSEGNVNRTNFYKTLALVAWSQQGKQITDKLFENYVDRGKYIRFKQYLFLIKISS